MIKEAFQVDSSGAATTDRLPEKDTEDDPDDPKAAGFKIKWRWERRDEPVHGMPGKTLELFKKIRKAHLKAELDNKYGHAEAQFTYMMNNIKLPQGCSIDAMDSMIEQISTLMYLLPSIHDDPNPAYQGGALSHKPRRNQPFAEGEMTEMLFNSVPYALQKLWKLDNNNQLVPTDRQELKLNLKILAEKNKDKLEEERQEKETPGNGGGKGGQGKKHKAGTQKPGQPPSTPNASGGSAAGEKKCKFCEKNGERPEAYTRHTTAKCKKYKNMRGDIQDSWVPSAQFRQTNAHQHHEGDTLLSAKKSKKSRKKRKKKSKSRRKKLKKSRRSSYSSSSSDSSTSSSSSSSSDSS